MCCFLGPLFFDWGPGYGRSGFFCLLAFQFPVDGVGGACPLVVLFLLLLCVLF